jgi:hypothetical protein
MQNSNVNELRQALSGAYSREVDRILTGKKDKSRADNIKRILDGLPAVNGKEDHAVVQAALDRYRAKVRHQRLPYGHKVVDGVLRMKITLVNDFHGTKVEVWPQVVDDHAVRFSAGQVSRCRRELCGVEGCTCGGFLGERWRGSGYADLFAPDTDGSVRARPASFFLDPAELEEY